MTSFDDYDIQILTLLQANGRLTSQQLSDLIGLSASQCSRRRIHLEQTRKILGYHARLSPGATGPEITGLIEVRLINHTPASVDSFHQRVASSSAITDAYKTTGDADYLLKVTVTDLQSLSRLISQLVADHQSVAHVKTSVVLNRLKEGGVMLVGGDSHNG
ncbi:MULTISPECIES: Lrp/AsnC family transcriptional regulator [Tatumella]|uniref:Lrp/AsnC family transcriptional regulator n=1 Tax=Tatumella punctata TaxID=399969 RepID=A0ABW1VM40_9GAMM|nr:MULTISPECIES: Lrp/AsnC family transcriptional regulator [unclassified Tatumella]MBS0855556.1 Lrp/AsnC family transcriptional regulator [Tatumella sp. JGM16]MBS0877061.1 Lrp/AsnC family transcriptional regulator [Tatumella sp. JGM82]MBS0890671.1 Lrp/AsnC family transcriptional regulator [Tatumella sp. JGM94]MBS0893342.1 Lrp/AsnC family transcriptional regulator [Tatumella sp. JGM130]MBS0901364.1 Lrp/AsnC family transcriptional regulator [Tatumella sp. JGM100]